MRTTPPSLEEIRLSLIERMLLDWLRRRPTSVSPASPMWMRAARRLVARGVARELPSHDGLRWFIVNPMN